MGNFLSHYTRLSALELILQKKQMRFGSFDKTNDPFENQNLEFTITNKIYGVIEYDSDIFFRAAQLKKPFKLMCFSFSNTIDYLYKRPRMWYQYGDDHRGCCIILDKHAFDSDFEALKIKKAKTSKSRVAYNLEEKEDSIISLCDQLTSLCPSPETIDIKKITDHMYKNRNLLLYTKMGDWKEEREYRYSIYTYEEDDLFIDISNSLHEIILGHKVSSLYQRLLFSWGKEYRIPISVIYWENGFPIKVPLSDESFQALDDAGIFR
jgi:hypothetical protein